MKLYLRNERLEIDDFNQEEFENCIMSLLELVETDTHAELVASAYHQVTKCKEGDSEVEICFIEPTDKDTIIFKSFACSEDATKVEHGIEAEALGLLLKWGSGLYFEEDQGVVNIEQVIAEIFESVDLREDYLYEAMDTQE